MLCRPQGWPGISVVRSRERVVGGATVFEVPVLAGLEQYFSSLVLELKPLGNTPTSNPYTTPSKPSKSPLISLWNSIRLIRIMHGTPTALGPCLHIVHIGPQRDSRGQEASR